MKKISRNFRLPENVVAILDQCGEESRTDMVVNGILLMSKIDWETIKDLASEHRVKPDLVVDAAVLYFKKLDLPNQTEKIIDYLEIKRSKALEREKAEKEAKEE